MHLPANPTACAETHSRPQNKKKYTVYLQDSNDSIIAFSTLTLLVVWQEGQPACKKTEWWGAGLVICLERGADLHMAQLMPLPLTGSCFSKVQIGSTFLVPVDPGSSRKKGH